MLPWNLKKSMLSLKSVIVMTWLCFFFLMLVYFCFKLVFYMFKLLFYRYDILMLKLNFKKYFKN